MPFGSFSHEEMVNDKIHRFPIHNLQCSPENFGFCPQTPKNLKKKTYVTFNIIKKTYNLDSASG